MTNIEETTLRRKRLKIALPQRIFNYTEALICENEDDSTDSIWIQKLNQFKKKFHKTYKDQIGSLKKNDLLLVNPKVKIKNLGERSCIYNMLVSILTFFGLRF